MLVLSRYESECIHIGDDVVVQVVRVQGGRVRIGIQAPRSISIRRGEVAPKVSKHSPVEIEDIQVTETSQAK